MSASVIPRRRSLNRESLTVGTSTALSFSRTHLQQVAEENVVVGEKGKYVNKHGKIVDTSEALSNSIQNSKHYHYSQDVAPPSNNPNHDTRTYVCLGLCIKAAVLLKKRYGNQVGVLNSSHATTPGGKFRTGCYSLEACICRGTLLWPSLTQFSNKENTYYTINKSEEFKHSPSTCAIFSPDVPIIRKDSFEAEFLDNYEKCSIVSLPPPNAFELGNDDAVRKALRVHIFRALCIFAENGCVDLILCSYGCGTRGNNAKMVAEVYKDVLSNELKGYFNKIIFSINPKKDQEYDDFTSVFEQS
jgi:uncharacterized protein (TIGR02452 family)